MGNYCCQGGRAAAAGKNINGLATEKTKPVESFKDGGGIKKKKPNASTKAFVGSNITILDHDKKGRDVCDYYEKVKAIGEGSTCKMYAVKKRRRSSVVEDQEEADQLFALKEISKNEVDDLYLAVMRNEVTILRTLDHPNIVRVYDVFESKRAIYLVMEYCFGGDLWTRIPYTEAQVSKIMTKLLSAIAYLHKKKVVHRDIKMENIIFESDRPDAEIKLIDFGLSKMYIQPSKPYYMNNIIGTVYTMSPEVVKGRYTDKADVWSCGVITYILLSNKEPFAGKSNKEILFKILEQEYDKDYEGPEWANISRGAKGFVSSLLTYDHKRRWSAAQSLRSSWLNKTFPLQERRPDNEVMNSVMKGLMHSANDGKFKKLAMQVIAYNSSTGQIKNMRKAFDQFDANNDGTITYWEFKKALSKCHLSRDNIKKLFSSVDVNHDGVINYTGTSFVEITSYWPPHIVPGL